MDTHNHFCNMSSSSILQKKGYIKKQVNECRIRFSMWYIGILGKTWEVIGVRRDRKINILCLQETKWVGEKSKDIDGYKFWYTDSYKFWYTDKVSSRNGVGIILDEVWKKNVVEVYISGDRLLSIKMVIEEETVNVNRE